MTKDKQNRELVNKVKIKDGERYYNAKELDQLEDLGIEAYEIIWNIKKKVELDVGKN